MLFRHSKLRWAGVATCTLAVGVWGGAAASTAAVRNAAQEKTAEGAAEPAPPPAGGTEPAPAEKPAEPKPNEPKPDDAPKPEPENPETEKAKAEKPEPKADRKKPAASEVKEKAESKNPENGKAEEKPDEAKLPVLEPPSAPTTPTLKPAGPEIPGPAAADAGPKVAALEAKLAVLESVLAGSPDAAGWKKYHQTTELAAAAARWKTAKPTRADRALADEAAARLARDLPTLADPFYADLRRTLIAAAASGASKEAWADDLRAAADRWRNPSLEIAAARAALLQKTLAVVAKLNPLSVGAAWLKQLDLPTLLQELQSPEPNLGYLREIEVAFTDGTLGLEWAPFLELRRKLSRFRGLLEAGGRPDSQAQFKAKLETLAELVSRRADDLSVEDRQTLNETYFWLHRSEQIPSLLLPIEASFQAPNLRVALREAFLKSLVDQPIDQVAPVREVILGTRIVGTGRTVGRIGVELAESDDRLAADLNIAGVNYSQSRGYNGPVVANTTGVTQLQGTKRIYFDGERLTSDPAWTWADADSTIHGFDVNMRFGKKIVGKIASKRAAQQKGQAEAIASQKARRRFQEQLESQFADGQKRFDAEMEQKFRIPLKRVGLQEPDFRLQGSTEAWLIQAALSQASQLAASESPLEAVPESMLSIQVHDTLIHNLTSQLAGRQIDEQAVRKDLQKILPASATATLTDEDEDPAPGSILFSMERPVTVKFDGPVFTIVMRTDGFTRGEPGSREFREFAEALTITARYRVEQTADGLRLVREGKIEVLPTGFQPGKDVLPLGKTITVKLMEKLVGKFLKPKIEPQGIDLVAQNGRRIGKLRVERFSPKGPWLSVGFKLTPAAPAPSGAD